MTPSPAGDGVSVRSGDDPEGLVEALRGGGGDGTQQPA